MRAARNSSTLRERRDAWWWRRGDEDEDAAAAEETANGEGLQGWEGDTRGVAAKKEVPLGVTFDLAPVLAVAEVEASDWSAAVDGDETTTAGIISSRCQTTHPPRFDHVPPL